jgi:acetoin utilization protein AcuB
MTARELISPTLPQLQPADKIAKALQLMDDFGVKHLPVVQKDNYLGLVSSDDLLDAADDNLAIENLAEYYSHPLVWETDHFLKVAQLVNEQNITVVPVLSTQKEFLGVISSGDLLRQLADFVGSGDPGGIIVLDVEKRQFSFSELSRIIETHDAVITQLNTDEDVETGRIMITLKINKTEISDIIASLQRFEYNVVYYHGEEAYENELRSNYDNLMNYLNI